MTQIKILEHHLANEFMKDKTVIDVKFQIHTNEYDIPEMYVMVVYKEERK